MVEKTFPLLQLLQGRGDVMVQIAAHGGNCCGVKHIWNLGNRPTYQLPAKANSYNDYKTHQAGYYWHYYKNTAPAETYEERFYRLLDWCVDSWSAHLIEVVIISVDDDDEGGDQTAWIPILEKCGFKLVNTHVNSNTGNELQTWHLSYGYGELKPDFLKRLAPKKKAAKDTKKAVFLS